ncbi:heme ABC exporter ATP-binding protein CcmA [Pseudaestuariivita sp.]|uniref:heme ABC exporter ATP-binding protein CcmA n=1 Tax=Pseudaestuariivita sp. TaxID=2211669 RepID=UPI0040581039
MLAVRDLAVGRSGTAVLEGLTFDVTAGRALILRGPNGIGKTTLLRTIAGLQPPLDGTIEMEEGAAAYASHADGIKTALTVGENLSFWAEVFGTAGIDAALDAFDLQGLRDRPAGKLSAGQKRRVGLARILVAQRPLWVMDEPTVSLDAFTVKAFAELVREHLAGGGAALIATHIDLGLDAETLDVSPFVAKSTGPRGFDEAFE